MMRVLGGGYTIAEAMIVLGITGVLFISAYTLFGGQQGKTEFSQAMRDIDSKIQAYANEVKAGSLPAGQSYPCSAASGRPVLDTSPAVGENKIGQNQDCIILGRALQLNTGQSDITVHTVLGTRTRYVGAKNTGVTATSLAETNPTTAADLAGNPIWQDSYRLSGGAKILSSRVNGLASAYNLIGLYTSLKSAGASANLSVEAYQLSGDVNSCVQDGPACGVTKVSRWDLCLQSASGNQTALLTANILPGGITTKLNFASCT